MLLSTEDRLYIGKYKMIGIYILINIVVVSGFLLNTPQKSGAQYSNQYLTIDDKMKIHHDLEDLRTEQEKALHILATQLQLKLKCIEQKVATQSSVNATITELVKLYHEVENNNTELNNALRHLKTQFNELESKYVKQTDELRNKTNELQHKLSEIEILKNRTQALERKQNITGKLKNKTLDIEHKLHELEQLKSINQLQTVKNLQNKVQTVDSSVHSLISREQARNEDFLALYNTTMYSIRHLTYDQNKMLGQILRDERRVNETFTDIYNITGLSLFELSTLQKEASSKFQDIQLKIEELNRTTSRMRNRVALTACRSSTSAVYVSGGDVVHFSNIKTNIGITDLSAYKSTGKFVCTVTGLYYVSAVIMSNTNDEYYYIYKNNNMIIDTYYGDVGSRYETRTRDFVTILDVGDEITVRTGGSQYIYKHSCFTIVKIN